MQFVKTWLNTIIKPALLNQLDPNNSLFILQMCMAYWMQDQNAKPATSFCYPLPTRNSEVSQHLKHTLKEQDSAPG